MAVHRPVLTSSCRTFEVVAKSALHAGSLLREFHSWRRAEGQLSQPSKAFASLSLSPVAHSVVLLTLWLLSLGLLALGVQDKRQWTALFYAAERGKQEQKKSGVAM